MIRVNLQTSNLNIEFAKFMYDDESNSIVLVQMLGSGFIS